MPTSIAIGRDGYAYVGQLVGFPGRPGSAYVWKINPNAKDTLCEVGHPRRSCKTWKGGFTSIMDLAFDPRNGTLYVYEIARKGWLAFEAGFAPGGVFPKAVLLEVPRHGSRRELVKGKLSQPGGIVVGRGGEHLRDRRHVHGRSTAAHPPVDAPGPADPPGVAWLTAFGGSSGETVGNRARDSTVSGRGSVHPAATAFPGPKAPARPRAGRVATGPRTGWLRDRPWNITCSNGRLRYLFCFVPTPVGTRHVPVRLKAPPLE